MEIYWEGEEEGKRGETISIWEGGSIQLVFLLKNMDKKMSICAV